MPHLQCATVAAAVLVMSDMTRCSWVCKQASNLYMRSSLQMLQFHDNTKLLPVRVVL